MDVTLECSELFLQKSSDDPIEESEFEENDLKDDSKLKSYKNKRSDSFERPCRKRKRKYNRSKSLSANDEIDSQSTQTCAANYRSLKPFLSSDHNLNESEIAQLSTSDNLKLLRGLKKYTVFKSINSVLHVGLMSTVYEIGLAPNDSKSAANSKICTPNGQISVAVMKIFKPKFKYYKNEIKEIKRNNLNHIKYCSKSPNCFFAENESLIIKRINKKVSAELPTSILSQIKTTNVICRFKNALILSPVYGSQITPVDDEIGEPEKETLLSANYSFAPRLDSVIKRSNPSTREMIAERCQIFITFLVETMLIFMPTMSTNNFLWSGEHPVPIDFCRARFILSSQTQEFLKEAIACLMSQIKLKSIIE